jgi:hypothetical protein
MAEAYKCDVVGCGEFSEGSPAGRVILDAGTKSLCKKHADALVDSFFPDLKPQSEETVPQAGQAVENGS